MEENYYDVEKIIEAVGKAFINLEVEYYGNSGNKFENISGPVAQVTCEIIKRNKEEIIANHAFEEMRKLRS